MINLDVGQIVVCAIRDAQQICDWTYGEIAGSRVLRTNGVGHGQRFTLVMGCQGRGFVDALTLLDGWYGIIPSYETPRSPSDESLDLLGLRAIVSPPDVRAVDDDEFTCEMPTAGTT